jgi:hypothetical protein
MRRRPFSPGDLYVNRVAAQEAAVVIEKKSDASSNREQEE